MMYKSTIWSYLLNCFTRQFLTLGRAYLTATVQLYAKHKWWLNIVNETWYVQHMRSFCSANKAWETNSFNSAAEMTAMVIRDRLDYHCVIWQIPCVDVRMLDNAYWWRDENEMLASLVQILISHFEFKLDLRKISLDISRSFGAGY